MHASDHRLRQFGERCHHAAAVIEEAALPREVSGAGAHLLEVVSGAEAAPVSSQDHNADRPIGRNRVELGLEGGDHRHRQRVESRAAIECERRDATGACNKDQRLGGRRGRVDTHVNLLISFLL